MKEVVKLITVLTVVCMISGLCLSFVNDATRGARAYQDKLEKLRALNLVLPEHDNEPDNDTVTVGDRVYYLSRSGADINGVAFETSTEKGYSGLIRVLVGVQPEGNIIGIGILEQKETPGLGSKIAEDRFKGQYKGKTLDNVNWAVKKDGGDLEQISGATISPRAVTAAVKEGLDRYAETKAQILGGAHVVQ